MPPLSDEEKIRICSVGGEEELEMVMNRIRVDERMIETPPSSA